MERNILDRVSYLTGPMRPQESRFQVEHGPELVLLVDHLCRSHRPDRQANGVVLIDESYLRRCRWVLSS